MVGGAEPHRDGLGGKAAAGERHHERRAWPQYAMELAEDQHGMGHVLDGDGAMALSNSVAERQPRDRD